MGGRASSIFRIASSSLSSLSSSSLRGDFFRPPTIPEDLKHHARVTARPPASPARSRWWKNVWNLPFSGISVSMGGITVDRIVNDPSLRRLACRVMDETIAIANADLRKHGCADDELLGEETVSPHRVVLGRSLISISLLARYLCTSCI